MTKTQKRYSSSQSRNTLSQNSFGCSFKVCATSSRATDCAADKNDNREGEINVFNVYRHLISKPDRRAVLRLVNLTCDGCSRHLRPTAPSRTAPITAEMQSASTPEMALDLLMQGNSRLHAALPCLQRHAQRQGNRRKANSFACVLACTIRVCAGVVFDQQIAIFFRGARCRNLPRQRSRSFELAPRCQVQGDVFWHTLAAQSRCDRQGGRRRTSDGASGRNRTSVVATA